MENNMNCGGHGLPEVPSQAKYISSNEVASFGTGHFKNLSSFAKKSDRTLAARQSDDPAAINHQNKHSVLSISIPFSFEEVQLHSSTRVQPQNDEVPISSSQSTTKDTKLPLPPKFFFKAFEDTKLETPKQSSEEGVLPQDKQWPFLLRFPASSFGICLGVSSQAILWKALAMSPSTEFLHITKKINLALWFISIALVATIFTIYLFKIIFYFEAVCREYHHHIRVNFFFAPWITLLFLSLGIPSTLTKDLPHALWYILMVPLFCLELKMYGQWMLGGKRKLSKVANPTFLLSIVGNFVGALLGASMGLKEGPLFFFAIGIAHYMVVFVTLFQMLPTNKPISKDLHPVFFLFVAPPSVASLAWTKIQGSFDYGSQITYFTAMFIYLSLAVRVNLFRGFKFSISWWAYTFPMTAAAIATINYTNHVTNVVTQALCVILSLISTFTVTAVLVSTIVHAFVLQDLFPNDLVVAPSNGKQKPHMKQFNLNLRKGSHGHAKKNEKPKKFVESVKNDLEA